MGEVDEDSCCIEFPCREGKTRLCVVTEEDMGKKRILAVEPNGKEKWFEKTQDLWKHLKKMGVSKNNRVEALGFLNTQLRSLKKHGESFSVGAEVFEIGSSEDKEV